MLTVETWRARAIERLRTGGPGSGHALLLISIDEFGRVGEAGGPPVGADVVMAVANKVEAETSEEDLICQWGADTIVVLLTRLVDVLVVKLLAERVRLRVVRARIQIDGPIGPVTSPTTVSIGCVLQVGADSSLTLMVWSADSSVLAAKRAGGNCVQVHPAGEYLGPRARSSTPTRGTTTVILPQKGADSGR